MDLDPHTGIRPGERWKQALQQANTRCEAVICLLSKHWNRSHECADGVPLRREPAQDHPVRPAGAGARHQHHLGVAALRPVPRPRPHHRDRALAMAGSRWCWTPWACSGCWTALRALGDRGRAFPVAAAGRSRPRPVSGVGTAGGSRCGGVLRARRPDSARPGCAARDALDGGGVAVRDPRPVGGREVVVSAGRAAAEAAPRRPPLPAAAHRAPRTGGADRRTRPGPRHPPAAHRPGLASADAGGDQERLPPRAGRAAAGLAGGGPRRPPAPGCWMWPPSSPPPPWCCRWIRPRNCSTPTPDPRPRASWSYWPPWSSMRRG